MISIVIISLSLLLSSSIILSDDNLENLAVNTGETATFICDLPEKYSNKQADFYGPTGRLLITKIDEDTASGDQTRFLLEHTYAWTWSLILSDASDDDAGEYTCRASSSSDDQTLTIIKRFNLTVLTPPKILDITIESNQNENLKENDQIILKCSARGIPQPNIIWRIPGRKFQSNKRNDRNIITYDNKLLIKNFSRTTPVDYQCIADNGIPPRDTRTKHLLPSISPELSIQSLIISSSQILLNCTILARPLNFARWKRNRFEMNNIKRKQINDYTVELLLLLDINTNSYGMYECEGENQFKVSKAFINIDETLFYNTTTTTILSTKYHRTSSSPSYAQIELLLNQGSTGKCHSYFIFFLHIILVNYSNGFFNKR